jgi:hypothetical protein
LREITLPLGSMITNTKKRNSPERKVDNFKKDVEESFKENVKKLI